MSAAFPQRKCEGCGRTGGGNPDGGLDNVTANDGHQLCGHCTLEFSDWFYGKRQAALMKWIEEKAKEAA